MYYDRKVLTRLCNHTSPNTRKTPKTLVRGHRNLWGYERFHFDYKLDTVKCAGCNYLDTVTPPEFLSPLFFFSKPAQTGSRHYFSRLIRPLFVPPAFFHVSRHQPFPYARRNWYYPFCRRILQRSIVRFRPKFTCCRRMRIFTDSYVGNNSRRSTQKVWSVPYIGTRGFTLVTQSGQMAQFMWDDLVVVCLISDIV